MVEGIESPLSKGFPGFLPARMRQLGWEEISSAPWTSKVPRETASRFPPGVFISGGNRGGLGELDKHQINQVLMGLRLEEIRTVCRILKESYLMLF
jgi:hypothetical protein